MMDYSNLIKLPMNELKVLAAKQGVPVKGNLKPETLAKRIIDSAINPLKQELKHPAEKKIEPMKINTEEEIREACKKFFDKEGFKAEFKNDLWHFSYKGCEDSGHMSVPLRVIRMKAENVSHGARNPATMNFDGERIFAA